jgi:cytochrome c peroxidase
VKKESTLAYVRALLPRSRTLGYASIFLLGGLLLPALAQKKRVVDPSQSVDWAAGMINHVQKMHNLFTHHDVDQSTQPAPPDIPKVEIDPDPSGRVETFQPAGATSTAENPFFQNLGTNGRTCFTCHQPQTGWTITAASASERFQASGGTDPLFRSIDGATCPTDDVSTLGAKRRAFKLLIEKGLIRIGLPLPPSNPPAPNQPLKFEVTHVDDPYHCTTNPVTGLQTPTMGILSMYRRPLPSTNLGFVKDTAIMWDGREPTLQHQALDATLGHAEGNLPGPSGDQQNEIVAFETGIFTAQIFDNKAHGLNAAPATGGPMGLPQQLGKFSLGLNDPFGSNFNPNIFDLYKPWLDLPDANPEVKDRESVARGEDVFNTKSFKIIGVPPIPDNTVGFCGTCHDSPNVGNHTVRLPLNIGIANAGTNSPPGLDISGLPVFTLKCDDGREFHVTDPGRALISGQCDDIGKFKGPILRGLAARAPYFHNGSAATLMDVVNFYNQRFSIKFTEQEKKDLVNFLKTL